MLDTEPTAMTNLSYLAKARNNRYMCGVKGRAKERGVRNVEVSLLTVWCFGFHFKETFGHDEVDGAGMDELAMKAGHNLAERFYERTDRDGANRGSCNITSDQYRPVSKFQSSSNRGLHGSRGVNVVKVSGDMRVT